MQQDFRFCFQGCCRLLNGHAVSRDQYEASIPKTFLAAPAVEALILCRNNPGDLQAAVERAVGFSWLANEASLRPIYRLGRPLFLTAELGHVSGKQQRMTSRNGKRLGNSRWSS